MRKQAVGNAGAEVAEGVSGKAADDLVRLESFITIRENNHQYHRVAKQASIKQIAQQKELEEHLGVRPGETTEDQRITLGHEECLGACAYAPVMRVDDTYHEDLDLEQAKKILDELE